MQAAGGQAAGAQLSLKYSPTLTPQSLKHIAPSCRQVVQVVDTGAHEGHHFMIMQVR